MWKTFLLILQSYRETSGNLYLFLVVILWIITAGVIVMEPVIFTLIIREIEEYFRTGVLDYRAVYSYTILWAIFIVCTIFLTYLYRYFFVYKLNMKNYVLTCKKFNEKIVHMWYAEYIGKKQGSLYKIYDRGVSGQESFLYFFFGDVIKNISSVIIIVSILIYVDIRMAFLALSMLPIMFLVGWVFVLKLSKKQKILNDKWDSMFGDIWNILSSFMLTKSLFLEKTFLSKMSKLLDKIHIEQNRVWKWWSLANVYTSFLVMISRILVLGFGVYFVVDGSLSFSELFLVFSYIWWIYFPLSFMVDRLNDIVKHLTSVQKMYEEFSENDNEDIYTWNICRNVTWNIIFDTVWFGYTKSSQTLSDVSLSISKWQKIALVWDTGAGKSTIVNLLLRFWDVTSGEILLDGVNINTLKKSSLRNHIGVVSQDNSLFNLSIEENLKFANPKATKADIEKALKQAEAHFVFDLPKWLKTVIGERGLKLSGGEKQRISIARLFLKNPEILVLDEATSALDNRTEKLIQKSLDKLMKGKTSIIIAHRLSTIQSADCIYVLEQWKIVESGNYEELMNKKKKFYALANPDKLILG